MIRSIVAPLVGAWIEIIKEFLAEPIVIVAPLVGAWIEIVYSVNGDLYKQSLPSWERGLKLQHRGQRPGTGLVAPLVGAWIEISM